MIVSRTEDTEIHRLLAPLNNREAAFCTQIERDFLRTLEGGCTAPIGALAKFNGTDIDFSGGLYALNGKKKTELSTRFSAKDYQEKGTEIAKQLLAQGGAALMNEFKSNT